MRSRTLPFLFALLFLFLSSCATGPQPNTANYEKILSLWIGEQIDKLIAVWGYPEKQFIAPNGSQVYVYERSRIISKPTYHIPGTTNVTVDPSTNIATVTTQPGITIGGGAHTYFCVTWIETNNENTIINWNWRGNDCTAGELK